MIDRISATLGKSSSLRFSRVTLPPTFAMAAVTYLSCDRVKEVEDPSERLPSAVESDYLTMLNEPGVPPHRLCLKVGSICSINILLNPDFAEAFRNRPSLLLSQLGPNAPSTTDTNIMLEDCRKNLESLLGDLKKRARGHRAGLERFKGAFLAKNTRESVENLHRHCQILNSMVTIDATVLRVTMYKEVKESRKEQKDWHQASNPTVGDSSLIHETMFVSEMEPTD